MDYRLQLFKMGLENFYPGWGDAKLAYLLHDYRCHWMGPALHSVLYLVGTPRISAWLQRPSQSGHGHEQKMVRKQLKPCSWSLSRPGRWLELYIRFYSEWALTKDLVLHLAVDLNHTKDMENIWNNNLMKMMQLIFEIVGRHSTSPKCISQVSIPNLPDQQFSYIELHARKCFRVIEKNHSRTAWLVTFSSR